MRRDRTGEPVDDDGQDTLPAQPHPPGCRKGWLPEDEDGHARPCLVCKPHLAAGTLRVGWTGE